MFIQREEGNYPIVSMCRWAQVSRSGYYSWRDRPLSQTARRREELGILIEWCFHDSEETYGYRRITAQLARMGVHCDPQTVRGVMQERGLVACQPRRRARTTVPAKDVDTRPDRVQRSFTAEAPGMRWVGDITYISTWEGFIYLATVLDCYSKKVVGYAMADHMRTSLVSDAIQMAVRRCRTVRGETVFHSDRGSQYTSAEFAEVLSGLGLLASVGRTGSCYDNAWAESFNATLKNERVHRTVYPTKKRAVADVTSWIELRYNQKRLHSGLGYCTPNEVEADWFTTQTAA